MRIQKCNIKYMSVILLLCISMFLSGCYSNGKVSENSSITSNIYQSEKPSEAILKAETDATASADTKKGDIASEEEKETEVRDSSADDQIEDTQGVRKDIDNNGIMDTVQIIRQNDGSKSLIRIYINEEQIFEYENPNVRIMSVDAFEYLDLDGDDTNEIFITAGTNANGRPLTDVLCLKQADGQWNRMDIPLNETGNNGFSFKITKGKDEFDFIISSEDIEQEIHFDATHFFEEDESGNINSIQAYRGNNYKEGDEVGFISAWGIWEARTGTYEGRNCIIALQGMEGPYGHGLGQINVYFAYNAQGDVGIMKVEYQPS